jgi:hypothetical protein
MQTPNIETTVDAAGIYTKYKESQVLVASAVALTTTVSKTVTSLLLSQGTWDITGSVGWHSSSGATVPTFCIQGISIVNNTLGTIGSFTSDFLEVAIPTDPVYSTGTAQVVFDNPGTVYLIANSTFASGPLAAYGFLRARRIY